MDALTDFFPPLRVASALYTRIDARAPWGVHFQPYHHAKFGVVVEGRCWLEVKELGPAVELQRNDFYLLPRGNAFSLRDDLGSAMRSFGEILNGEHRQLVAFGGGGAQTTIVGGRFVFAEPGEQRFLDLLPDLVYVRAASASPPDWQATLQLLASETARPGQGSQLVVDRLAEILFLQTIRAYLEADADGAAGWRGAVSDKQIGQALALMNQRVDRAWTLETLALEVGMSRSAFAERFKRLVGTTVLDHLTRLRMQRAGRWLREGGHKVADIAQRVGYDSEASFSRVFKRYWGATPGQYRRAR